MTSEIRQKNAKLSFFIQFGGYFSEKVLGEVFPIDLSFTNYMETEYKEHVKRIEDERAKNPAIPREIYNAHKLGMMYDMLTYRDVFSVGEMEMMLKDFMSTYFPADLGALYEADAKKREQEKLIKEAETVVKFPEGE